MSVNIAGENQCPNPMPHGIHDWLDADEIPWMCAGVESETTDVNLIMELPLNEGSYEKVDAATKHLSKPTPELFCGQRYIHIYHMWYNDGLAYGPTAYCPGYQAVNAANVESASTPVVSDSKFFCEGVKGCTGHLVTPKDDEQPTCSPPSWRYHTEPAGAQGWRVIKKYGESPSGQIIAQYESPLYARLVADVLNGGVLMGFEVEK